MIPINVGHGDWPEEQEKGHGGLDQRPGVVIFIILVKYCGHFGQHDYNGYSDDSSTQALSTCMEPSSKRDFEEQRHENPCW